MAGIWSRPDGLRDAPRRYANCDSESRRLQTDIIRFTLLSVISLLVSRIGQTSRRRESELRHTAEELEQRVKERTEEAVRSAEAMREAMESMREQAQLLDLAYDSILSMDLGGIIRFWNHGAEKMYGWTREEALGKVSHHLFRTEFPESREEIDNPSPDGGALGRRTRAYEERRRPPDGDQPVGPAARPGWRAARNPRDQ